MLVGLGPSFLRVNLDVSGTSGKWVDTKPASDPLIRQIETDPAGIKIRPTKGVHQMLSCLQFGSDFDTPSCRLLHIQARPGLSKIHPLN